MKSLFVLAICAAAGLTAIACRENDSPKAPAAQADSCPACDADAPATSKPSPARVEVLTTGVRTIVLPVIDADLPPGPGKLTLVSACTICHTPRYVTMQPNFSKKKWTEEVEKMKKVYGAPIQDEQVEPIVNYLVAIRGNGQ